MTPQSIELSPLLHGFSDVLESLGNIPFLKISLVVVIGIALALALLLGM
jgi:hypothetical protein